MEAIIRQDIVAVALRLCCLFLLRVTAAACYSATALLHSSWIQITTTSTIRTNPRALRMILIHIINHTQVPLIQLLDLQTLRTVHQSQPMHTNMMLESSLNKVSTYRVQWLISVGALVGNWPRAAREPLCWERAGGRFGKTKHCWSGILVSVLPALILYFVFISSVAWFRLFVGDLSNDVSDDVLTNAFNKYTSFTKARVIRDRLSQKVA